MPVQDGPACTSCGLPNYSGLCPVCRGDEVATREEGLPYPWPPDNHDDQLGPSGEEDGPDV
jgi:hypothetical protein